MSVGSRKPEKIRGLHTVGVLTCKLSGGRQGMCLVTCSIDGGEGNDRRDLLTSF